AGDYVLREMGARLKEVIRTDELLARYGGGGVAIVLPEGTRENAPLGGGRIPAPGARPEVRVDGQPVPVTVGVGVATGATAAPAEPEALLALADEKLYEAKRTGRNRVCG